MSSPSSAERFVTAARGGTVDRAPVWLMRQAGRYLPEYMALRREHDFVTCCTRPDLAAEISLQPWRRFGMDGVVVFCDILMPLTALGIDFAVVESTGPVLTPTITSIAQIKNLRAPDASRDYQYLTDTLKLLRSELQERAAVIGFCGAPWTVATYMVTPPATHPATGSKRNHAARATPLLDNPELTQALFDLLVPMLADYLAAQAAAGAHVVQIFDTWAGLLDAEQYAAVAAPALRALIDQFRTKTDGKIPVVIYGNNCAHLVPQLAQMQPDVISVDWRTPISTVRAQLSATGHNIALQGNLDPETLLTDCDTIRAATQTMLADAGRTGYIANLGHGVIKETPPEHVGCFVDTVRQS